MKKKFILLALGALVIAIIAGVMEMSSSPFDQNVSYGELVSCYYSSSGDMSGNVFVRELVRQEDGSIILRTEEKKVHSDPLVVKEYSCDDDALDQMQAIIEKYSLTQWKNLEPNDLIALDAAQDWYSITYREGEKKLLRSYSFGDVKIPEGYEGALKEYYNGIVQWEKEENLISSKEVYE